MIADEQAESPYERAVEILTNEALRDALENLSYRERRVLELRYGLGGEHPRTLDEVGRTFNVTRERIRQIENQSLKKLQNLREAQKLRDDVEIASGYALRRLGHRTDAREVILDLAARRDADEARPPVSRSTRSRRRAPRPGISSAIERRSCLDSARQRLERALRTPHHRAGTDVVQRRVPRALQVSIVGHPAPCQASAHRWRQRLDTSNGLPALMPTARAPCGVFSTTTTREAPRSSTATSRAAGAPRQPPTISHERPRPAAPSARSRKADPFRGI